MILRVLRPSFVWLFLAMAAAPPATAQFWGEFPRPPPPGPSAAPPQTSLDEAVQRIRRDTGGRILSADTIRKDGIPTHRVKVLMPSGRVRVFYVDAGGG